MKKILSAVLVLIIATSNIVFAEDAYNDICELIKQCEANGYSCAYEKVSYNTLLLFDEYIKSDETNDTNPERLAYNKSTMDKIYNEIKLRLESYLNGESETMVPEYTNPEYSVGYGHFSGAYTNIDKFRDLGMTNIQIETGPSLILNDSDVAAWGIHKYEGSSGVVSVNSSLFTEGEKSLRIYNTTQRKESGNYISVRQTVDNLVPGGTYTLSFSYRGSDTEFEVTAADNIFTPSLSTSWESASYTFEAQESITVSFNSSVTGDGVLGNLYIDDVRLSESGSDRNLLFNPGFESQMYDLSKADYVFDTLKKAEEDNISVNLLISPHYFPESLADEGVCADTSGTIDFNINHSSALDIINEYIDELIPAVNDYSSLGSIVVLNEPNFSTANWTEFYNPLFRQFLEELHGDIEILNTRYSTDYESFEEICIPAEYEAVPVYYDWIQFNDTVFADWQKCIADRIRMYTDVPLSAKVMNYMYYNSNPGDIEHLTRGCDYDMLKDIYDIAGCDSWAYVNGKHDYLNEMMWYDYLGSVTDKDIYNSEDHIIADKDTGFGDEYNTHINWNMLQGAIHGRKMSTIWVFERSYDENSVFYGSILHRPGAVEQAGKSALDLARLGQYIKKLDDNVADVAILYSKATRVYDENYMKKVYNAYKGATFAGHKVGFVSETDPEMLNDYKYLLIPEVINTTPEMAEIIESFIKDGNKVFAAGDGVLLMDAYGSELDTAFVNDRAVRVDGSEVSWKTALEDNISNTIEIINKSTGESYDCIEYSCNYGENAVINICNYSDENITDFEIYVDGEKRNVFYDAVSEAVISPEVLYPYTPVILELPVMKLDEVTDVAVDGNMISWENDNGSANVYSFDNGSVELIGSTGTCVWEGETGKTYIIRNSDEYGAESFGRAVTISDDDLFEVLDFIVERSGGSAVCELSVKNVSGAYSQGVFSILCEDSAGNIKSMFSSDCMVMPGAIKKIKTSFDNVDENDIIYNNLLGDNEYQ